MPLKVACRGIDRYCERASRRRAGRRRPVRIEFCEADILDAFDDWRRAVGVVPTSRCEAARAETHGSRRSLSHIERVVARLRRAGGGRGRPAFERQIGR